MESLLQQMKVGVYVYEACAGEDPGSRTEKYCVEVRQDVLRIVVDGFIANYNQRDCFVHSDLHAFNILVKSKPSSQNLESFGPNGIFNGSL